jgi:hypothetical protein
MILVYIAFINNAAFELLTCLGVKEQIYEYRSYLWLNHV